MNNQEWHQSKGAEFEDFFGVSIPSHYGDPQQEYWKLRKTVALRDVSHFGKIRVTGKDRHRFLNGMLSNDIKTLEPGKGTWALSLDVKGHLQADLKVYAFADHLLIVLQHYLVNRLMTHLDRYIISEDVKMTDVTSEFGIVQILGPESESVVRAYTRQPPSEILSFVETSVEGIKVQVIRMASGFALLHAAADSVALMNSLDLSPVGMRAFDVFRIETGLALMHIDMDETNFPQETRLDDALNFHKGCYLGQETMARIDAQGHVNKQLMGLVSTTEFKKGDPVFKGDREIGKITSTTRSYLLDVPLCMAFVRREFAKDGEQVEFGEHRTTAVVRQLPLTT